MIDALIAMGLTVPVFVGVFAIWAIVIAALTPKDQSPKQRILDRMGDW